MSARVVAVRATALAMCLLVIGVACSSSDASNDASSDSKDPQPATSTSDASQKPNTIPFNVGDRVGLPNGWLVQVTKVHRPSSNAELPETSSGREYVAVDVTMEKSSPNATSVRAADLFELGDSSGKLHRVVALPGEANGLDGTYSPQTKRSGRLVFEVPVETALRLAMDGPQIGTQKAIFMVDPPLVGPGD